MLTIGEMISDQRVNKKMTQEEFASRLGVTSQAVSKWERNQSLPDVSLLTGICQVLQMDANELLGLSKVGAITESNDTKIRREIRNNLCAEPVKLVFGAGIVPTFVEGLKTDYIDQKRKALVKQNGLLMPIIRIIDEESYQEMEYAIFVYDQEIYRGILTENDSSIYTMVIDQLFTSCEQHYAMILNKQMTKTFIDNVKEQYQGIADDLIPQKVSYLTMEKILASLVKKTGNIRNMIHIIETVEEEMIMKSNTDIESIVAKIISKDNYS